MPQGLLPRQGAAAALSSVTIVDELHRILRVAPDVQGAFLQACKLLEQDGLRKCTGIYLWNHDSRGKWVAVAVGEPPPCRDTGATQPQSCWKKNADVTPCISLKDGQILMVRRGASWMGKHLDKLADVSEVDMLCYPVRMGDGVLLSVAIRPLRADVLTIQGELFLAGAVCALLGQWIELRFDPQEFTAPKNSTSSMTTGSIRTPLLPVFQSLPTKGASAEEMLTHRVGEMVSFFAAGSPAEQNLYNRIIEFVEKGMIRWALCRTKMVQSDAARLLGISRNTLRAKMKQYGLFTR